MADVFVPGVKSRFDTDKMISGLMEIERVPRNRAQKEVDTLKEQKEHWQILGRRITEMRDSARHLFSFQNPFNERSALSSDDYVLSAESSRESMDSSHNFTVKQLASADKFVSNPLPANYTVPAGTYGFSTGKNDIRFKFSGGGIQEFADVLNKRGEGKVAASLIAIKPNTKSFIIESLDTGAENHLTFSDDAEKFAISTGILAAQSAGPKLINIAAVPAGAQPPEGAALAVRQSASGGGLSVPAMAEVRVALEDGIVPTDTMLLRFETQVSDNEAALAADRAYALRLAAYNEEKAAREAARADGAAIADAAVAGESAAENTPGEADPGEAAGGAYASDVKDVAVTKIAGSDAAEGEGGAAESAGAVAEEGAAVGGAADTFPEIEPPPPHVDNLNALVLLFSDGTSAQLHPVKPSGKWDMQSYQLAQVAAGRTAAAIVIKNENTHRDIAIKDIQLFDPVGEVVTEPRAPISRAQDAIIDMDGIEIERPVNKIDDLIPGMTINARAVSDVPVSVGVQTDTEAVKDGVISLVGNYNKLMVELNVLTRSDDSIVRELNYLSRDEQDALRKRLG
ncbi:MAG: flagellar filament capping protein FliD, partial [Spirochaetaceae bacterium]|nr:flagellar filament capping protein FliD [Spirochaetaceae bacterium]